jgi:hypothetical protein
MAYLDQGLKNGVDNKIILVHIYFLLFSFWWENLGEPFSERAMQCLREKRDEYLKRVEKLKTYINGNSNDENK